MDIRISEWDGVHSAINGVKGHEMYNKGVVCSVVGVVLCWGWGAHQIAEAGSLKVHDWQKTCFYVAQDVYSLGVTIDVGYYFQIEDQEAIIVGPDNSTGDPLHTYAGYKQSDVVTNFPAILSVSISPVGTDVGQWNASVAPENVPMGTTSVKIFVQGENVGQHVLSPDAPTRVAVVTLSVVPQ